MKKTVSLILVCIMLVSVLAVSANAAEPFGTIVEIPYTTTAPSMEAEAPDASWGEKIITITKDSPNAGITQYVQSNVPKVRQDVTFDLYARWTDTTLYLCFVSPDDEIVGGSNWYSGDGVQMVVYPGILDVSYCNNKSAGWTNENEYFEFDWTVTLDFDDESTSTSLKAEDHGVAYADIKNNALVVKFEMPFVEMGFGKNEVIGNGTYISFSLIRGECTSDSVSGVDNGFLEWGDFYSAKKGWDPNDTVRYMPCCENSRTTTANTFKLIGKNGGTPATTDTPATTGDKVTLKGTPSSWAKAEVEAALAADLIPEELTDGFTNGISRANLSKILSKLLDKVYGKAPEKSDAKFTDTTDADVLKAANLGIINGYEQADGTFMFKPNNTLKRSEMAAIINRVAKLCGQTVTGFDGEVTFTDTASHWCKGELGWPVHNGIVKGTSDTTFSPENTLTVEQTIMMIYRTYTALK